MVDRLFNNLIYFLPIFTKNILNIVLYALLEKKRTEYAK